jgi:hypothetical protein
MQRFTASELRDLSQHHRIQNLHKKILDDATLGKQQTEIWWANGDDQDYLKQLLLSYFPGTVIKEETKYRIVISWSRADIHEQLSGF